LIETKTPPPRTEGPTPPRFGNYNTIAQVVGSDCPDCVSSMQH